MLGRKSILLAVLAAGALGFAGSAARANTIGTAVLTQGSYSYGDGGEFTATFSNAGGGSLATQLGTTQQVFCVETNEEFSPGTTYYGNLSEQIKYNNGQFSPTVQPPAAALAEVQYLYTQFSTGALDDTSGIAGKYFSDGNRQDNAGALQNAIWQLLSETGGSTSDDPTLVTYYKTEAVNAVNGGWTNTHVEILNMWTAVNGDLNGSSDVAQDQLVYNPSVTIVQSAVPLPATASLGVMMLGCVGLFSLARRVRKTARPQAWQPMQAVMSIAIPQRCRG